MGCTSLTRFRQGARLRGVRVMAEACACKGRRRPGQDGRRARHVTPQFAGWKYVGFEAYRRAAGEDAELATATASESCIVVLSGTASAIAKAQAWREIGERASVFDDRRCRSTCRPARRARLTRDTDAEIGVCTAPGGKRGPRASSAPDEAVGARPGHQHALRVRHPAADRAGRAPAGGRGDHAVRPLVELSAAQARHRRTAGRKLARGNLLPPAQSRRRASRSSASTPTTARSTSRWPSRITTS